jgi:hypothetical protein
MLDLLAACCWSAGAGGPSTARRLDGGARIDLDP